METDEEGSQKVVPFQLQFDKPLPFQIKIAEWNPEKDLLAMVTEDSKILLHRFNWQRLWTVSPGKCITSLCWRPDGKAIAVGLEDGTISLHDVENGKMLRSIKSHTVAVVCLNWEEDGTKDKDECSNISTYEDRTSRLFPPPPRAPKMPGVVAGDSGFMDGSEDSSLDLSNSSLQRFNILCSGDKEGSICFSIFGIFSIGKLNIHRFSLSNEQVNNHIPCQLLNASICKVTLAKDLCHLTVICTGELLQDGFKASDISTAGHGLHCLVLDTSIFSRRKNELHQVAQQASNIEDLTEVIRTSLSVMSKQWSDAMNTFHKKFDSLSTLITDHGLDSTPQDEFLSLLGGARTSPPIHQFLVNSLGEAGLKRIGKVVCSAGKELQLIVLDHLQPAAEIIAFRLGELRGLSKWRSRFQGIGLDEKLIDNATEKAGMLIIQVERFMKMLASVVQQFSNFFSWLLKSTKILMSEPSDQLSPVSSELVIIFLKFLYNQDPVRQLLEADHTIEIDVETQKRVEELVHFGGFLDTKYLQRTLAQEFQQMEDCFEEAFKVPFTTISKKIIFQDLMPLFPIASSPKSSSTSFPTSISYYQEDSEAVTTYQSHEQKLVDYISFRLPDESFDTRNCVGIIRGFMHDLSSIKKGTTSLEAVLFSVPEGYSCVDLCLYKENQIVLLLNESTQSSESLGSAVMMIVQSSDFPFESSSRLSGLNQWILHGLKDSIMSLQMENEKVRNIPHSVSVPLAVSASRGVACVFAARRRALVYILEEDEDEASDME